jgi:chromosome segregation ATPase
MATSTASKTRINKHKLSTPITGSDTAIKSLESFQLSYLSEELKKAEKVAAQSQQEHKKTKESMQDLRAKVRVLEDALLFRSEEIGLSGHAGLLSKVAQLKGEVAALRDELLNKNQVLQLSEEAKSSMNTNVEDLQHQILTITQRLAITQQENYRLTHNNLGELLQKAEEERDLLLQYIQQDMVKSNTLALQIEHVESDLRVQRKRSQELQCLYDALQDKHSQCVEHCKVLERDLHELQRKEYELQQLNNRYNLEVNGLEAELHQKRAQEEEYKKRQSAIYQQVRLQKHAGGSKIGAVC